MEQGHAPLARRRGDEPGRRDRVGDRLDRLIEAVRVAFRHDETLGGVVETTMSDGRAGPQLDDSGPAMFAGVLCHHARLTLSTVVGAPTGTEVIADFATGSLTWDRTPADGATDAEDTINPETEQ